MNERGAKVALVEDLPLVVETVSDWLFEEGHELTLALNTVAQALSKIKDFGSLGINVVVVDGSLSASSPGTNDGEKITKEIKRQYPNMPVIGFSEGRNVPGADYNVPSKRAKKT